MNELLLSVGEAVAKVIPDGELGEDDLENVAGGALLISLGAGSVIFATVAGGLVGVAAVGALAYGGYWLYKRAKKK